jgi:hypothetical protein
MKTTRLFTLFAALALTISAYAWDFKDGDFYYNTISENPFTAGVTYELEDNPYNYEGLTFPWIPSSVNPVSKGLIYHRVIAIESYAFYRCSTLKNVVIPSSITSIGDSAFAKTNLTTVFFHAENCTLGSFANIATLKNVQIYPEVKTIPSRFIYNCKLVTSIVLPENVTSIGSEAFGMCSGLVNVSCRSVTPPTLATAFPQNTGMTLKVPCSAVETYKTTTNWQDFKTILGSTFSGFKLTLNSNNTQYGTAQVCPVCDNMIEAIAKPNYHFVRWNDGKTENPRTIALTSDSTFVATFAVDTYRVTATTNQTAMGTVTGGKVYEYNAQATIQAIPNYGYTFVQWNDGNTQNPRRFTVTSDSAFVATFEPKSFNVTATTTQTAMGQVTGSGIYEYNTQATIEAIPNEGYTFVQWNDLNTENPRTILVTSDATYTATFMTITAIEQVTAETLNLRIENGTILCDGDMRIYDLIGRDVTHQNGLLQGVYMVRVDNLVVKVIVK